jgi:uncharacterized Zn finger protein
MTGRVYARQPPRRGGVRIDSWWARALLRVLEEVAYDETQLTAARSIARSGRIGGLIAGPGGVSAAVDDASGLWTVRATLPELDPDGAAAVAEVLPPYAGDVAAGELPLELVERFEELGVELLPGSEEIETECSCRSWQAVCTHALGVLLQLAWLADTDPTLLFVLRGVESAAASPAAAFFDEETPSPASESSAPSRTGEDDRGGGAVVDDLDVAEDAARRAREMLAD